MYRDKTMIELHDLYKHTMNELNIYIHSKSYDTTYQHLKMRSNLLKSLISNKQCKFENLINENDIYAISSFYIYEGYVYIDTSTSILRFISKKWTESEKYIFESIKRKYIVG